MPIGFWAVCRSEVLNSIQARTGIIPTEAETNRAVKLMRDGLDEAFEEINFMIYPLESEEPIGFIELDGIAWHHRTSWVGIGIGNRDYWGQGYGSDAMRILSRYAFDELGLYRLNLNVFSNNTRAIQAYENVGFKVEGAIRDALHRDNQRWDLVFMGLLEEDFRHQT